MADRLTQLQDAVNVQAENLTNSVGLLQQSARPQPFPEFPTFSREGSKAYQQLLAEANILFDLPKEDDNNDNNKNGKENTSNGIESDGRKSQINTTDDNNIIDDDNNIDTSQQKDSEDNSKLFAKLITKTAKDIALIIDSLPEKMESGIQEGHIVRLEIENREEAKILEDLIAQAENLLDTIQTALKDIAQNQMTMKQLEAQMLNMPMISELDSTKILSTLQASKNQMLETANNFILPQTSETIDQSPMNSPTTITTIDQEE